LISDFIDEPKNYHAWQYRQWVLQRFGGSVEDEMKFVEELLRVDVYNNSAWNHRSFVLRALDKRESLAWLSDEQDYVKKKLNLDSENQSALQYTGWLQTLQK